MSKFKQLQKDIQENDNRCTAKPYLLLLRTKRQIVVDGDYSGERVYVENVTDDYQQFNTREEAEQYLIKEWYDDDEMQPEEIGYGDIAEVYMDTIDIVDNVFLTDKGYKAHLEANAHNLGDHDTYGIHAFRNEEVKTMFEALDRVVELEEEVKQLKERLGE